MLGNKKPFQTLLQTCYMSDVQEKVKAQSAPRPTMASKLDILAPWREGNRAGDIHFLPYAKGAGRICPVCVVQFSTRLMAIHHAYETRLRGRCTVSCNHPPVRGNFRGFLLSVLQRLNADDRRYRHHAHTVWQSQLLALFLAIGLRLRATPHSLTSKLRRLVGKKAAPF